MDQVRVLSTLRFELVAIQRSFLIVWPGDPPTESQLLDLGETWMTAQAGDGVVFNDNLEIIAEVSLHRVLPVGETDRIVTSGAAWLAGE